MNRSPVVSSNIAAAGWEGGVLEIEFKSGDVWRYEDVPEAVYKQMLAAPSIGRFYQQAIRGRYRGSAA